MEIVLRRVAITYNSLKLWVQNLKKTEKRREKRQTFGSQKIEKLVWL